MSFCTSCGHDISDNDAFCAKCGKATGKSTASAMPPRQGATGGPRIPGVPGGAAQKTPQQQKVRKSIIASSIMTLGIGAVPFFMMSRGCSSVEGGMSMQSKRASFELAATQCKSADRVNSFGFFVLPETWNQGAIKAIQDQAHSTWIVQVELPGTCPSEDADCEMVTLDKARCPTFEVSAHYNSTTVNDVRLMDARLKLDCKLEDGGTVVADLTLENCD